MSYSQSTYKCADFIIACAKEINKNISIDNFNCKIANLDRVNELIVNKLDNSFFVTDVFEKKYNNDGDFFIDRKIMLIKKSPTLLYSFYVAEVFEKNYNNADDFFVDRK